MVSGVYWSVGDRAVNEDTVALESVRTDRGECTLVVVCDGIGTLERGEIVSGYVTECLIRWFYSTGIHMYASPVKKIKRSLCKCIYDCHMELKATAVQRGITWGTTCTCLCIWGGRYVCLHLGDTVAYRMRMSGAPGADKAVKCLTRAHVNDRGELIRCVGSMRYYEPDISSGWFTGHTGVLVASDGFAGCYLSDELREGLLMGENVTQERLERRLAALGNEASSRGSRDNRSAICVIL